MPDEVRHLPLDHAGDSCKYLTDEEDQMLESSIFDLLSEIITKINEVILADGTWTDEVLEYSHDVASRLKQWKLSLLWISQGYIPTRPDLLNASDDDKLRALLEDVQSRRPFLSSVIKGHLGDVGGWISALTTTPGLEETPENHTMILEELEQSLGYFGLQLEPLGTFIHRRTMEREGLLNETRPEITASLAGPHTQYEHVDNADFDKQGDLEHQLESSKPLLLEVAILSKDERPLASNAEPLQHLTIRSRISDEKPRNSASTDSEEPTSKMKKPSVSDLKPSQNLKATADSSDAGVERTSIAGPGETPLAIGVDPSDLETIVWSAEYQQYYVQTFNTTNRQWVTKWLPIGEPKIQDQGLHEKTMSNDNSHIKRKANQYLRQEILNWKTEVNEGNQSNMERDADPNALYDSIPTRPKLELETMDAGFSLADIESTAGGTNPWSNSTPPTSRSEQSQTKHVEQGLTSSSQYRQLHRPSSYDFVLPHRTSNAEAKVKMSRGRSDPKEQTSLHKASSSKGSHTGSGPEGSSKTEELDSSFRIRRSQWFDVGRVFAVVMRETAGNKGALSYVATSSSQNRTSFQWVDNLVHTQIRRFVVVYQKREFCYACPIFTYGERGTTKRGLRPDEHGIIHSYGRLPTLVTQEIGMIKRPICVAMSRGVGDLHFASRIDYGIHHPMRYNVKVKDIGQVRPSDIYLLVENWRNEEGRGNASLAEPIAEEVGEASAGHPLPTQPDPDLYHPTDNIYGYDKYMNPHMYHPVDNPYGYHPIKNRVGYHPQSSSFSYHPEHNRYGYHPQRAPFCYHPAFCPFGYHSTVNPNGYHPITMPYNYHPRANEYGYHEDLNPYAFQPTLNPDGYHPSVNPGAYHPEDNPGGLRESESDEEGDEQDKEESYVH